MICPICKKEMVEGRIPDNGKKLVFTVIDSSKILENRHLIVNGFFGDYIPLTKQAILKGQNYADSFYCPTCRIIITPVKG